MNETVALRMLHTGAILSNDSVNVLRLDAVDDVVTASGDKVAIGEDVDIVLQQPQHPTHHNLYTDRLLLYQQTHLPTERTCSVCRKH